MAQAAFFVSRLTQRVPRSTPAQMMPPAAAIPAATTSIRSMHASASALGAEGALKNPERSATEEQHPSRKANDKKQDKREAERAKPEPQENDTAYGKGGATEGIKPDNKASEEILREDALRPKD